MRRLRSSLPILLAAASAALGAVPAGSPMLDHAAGVRLSAQSGLPLLVVFGQAGCPFTAPAKAFLEGPEFQAEFGERLVLAYVDGATEQGRSLVERHRVDSWPLAVIFSPAGEELWRTVAPHDMAAAREASKFAVEGLMQVLADETDTVTNIRSNSVNPGRMRTPMRAAAYPGEVPDALPAPDQVLGPFLYLLGPESRGVTGRRFDAQ